MRRPLAALPVLLLLAAAAGCAPAEGDPAPSGTAVPSPSATAPVTAPVVLLDGDCAALVPADLPEELGTPVPAAATTEGIAVTTLGGLSCFYDGALPMRIDAFPVDVVASDVAAQHEEATCGALGFDGYGCEVARTAGGTWVSTSVLSSTGTADVDPAVAEAAADAVAAHLEGAPAGTPVTRTGAWWDASCADLEEDVDLSALLGSDDIRAGSPVVGVADGVVDAVVAAAGSYGGFCAWSAGEGEDIRTLELWLYPGAAWVLAEPREGTEPVAVDGAETAVARDADGVTMHEATDGENLLVASASRAAVGAEDALAAVLAALADGTGARGRG